MALPRKLKFFNIFNEGNSYLQQATEVVPPKLARNMSDYRAGGMDSPIKSDSGGEALQLEFTCGGLMEDAIKQFGAQKHDAVGLRFTGSYQSESEASPVPVEINVRGRHSVIDTGSAKTGDETAFKVTSELSYYKLTVNSKDLVEIDIINMIHIVDGKDILADHRAAIGI